MMNKIFFLKGSNCLGRLTVFLVFIGSINCIYAQGTAFLKGKVTHNQLPIAGASIQIPAINKTTITNDSGYFQLEVLQNGQFQIVCSSIGFQTVNQLVNFSAGKTSFVEFTLQPDYLNLSQVVVTGTRTKIAQYNAPVITSTIGTKTFEMAQALTVSEGLNFSPGLRIENNCQNCGFVQLRMNGLDGPYSQVLINSRPVFSALAGVYGLEMIPTAMVDKIEVVRGGGSALYGGNAIAGTVNIITKDPVENGFEVGINQSYTALAMPDRTITFNGTIVDKTKNKGASFYGYNRNRAPWDANGDGFSQITKLRNQTLGADAFWNISPLTKLKAGIYTINEFRRGGNNFHLQPHQTALTEQLQHRIIGVNTSLEHYSSDLKHKLSAYTSVQTVNRESYYGGGGRIILPGETLTDADILAINAYGNSNDISVVGGVQYAYAASGKSQWIVGSEYQYNKVNDAMPGYQRSINQRVTTWGSYLQWQWQPIDKLTFLTGGRLDNIHINGNYLLGLEAFNNQKTMTVAVPRFSAMYQLHSYWKLRFSYAQGYRAPQAFDEDLHIQTVGGEARFIRLDNNLQTERSNSFTASVNYTKTLGRKQINWVLEVFQTQLNRPFILSNQEDLPSGVAVITKRNGNGATVAGLNMEGNMAIGKKWLFQSGLTAQSAKYKQVETIWEPEDGSNGAGKSVTEQLLRTPNLYGYYSLVFSPINQFSVSVSGVYTGTMKVAHVINPETEQTVIKQTPSFFEQNIKFTFRLPVHEHQDLVVFTGMHNVFNSFQTDFDRGALRDAGYVYGPSRPRTFFIGLQWKWH
ncbi:MAG: TonB-dependent receptor [Chitinophagaceae bacterium]